jgi:hypothetical protein
MGSAGCKCLKDKCVSSMALWNHCHLTLKECACDGTLEFRPVEKPTPPSSNDPRESSGNEGVKGGKRRRAKRIKVFFLPGVINFLRDQLRFRGLLACYEKQLNYSGFKLQLLPAIVQLRCRKYFWMDWFGYKIALVWRIAELLATRPNNQCGCDGWHNYMIYRE